MEENLEIDVRMKLATFHFDRKRYGIRQMELQKDVKSTQVGKTTLFSNCKRPKKKKKRTKT